MVYAHLESVLENETYKILWDFEINKKKEEYLRRTRKLLETKLYSRYLIKGINNWTILLVRYSGPFLKWTRREIRQMNQKVDDDTHGLTSERGQFFFIIQHVKGHAIPCPHQPPTRVTTQFR